MKNSDSNPLKQDIVSFAQLVNARHKDAKIQQVLDAFAGYFDVCPVSMSTSTQANKKREVAFGFVDFGTKTDLIANAIESGALNQKKRPISGLIQEIQSKYPILGFGATALANFGLEKITTFLAQMFPTEQLNNLEHLPPAIKANSAYFKNHELNHFSIVTADFKNESVEIHFALKSPFFYVPDRIKAMIEDLGFEVPADEVLQFNANAVFVSYTFSWKTNAIESLCFYVPCPLPQMIPPHPLLQEVAQNATILAPFRAFIIGNVYSKTESYINIEVDYKGQMMGVLTTCACLKAVDGADASIRFLKEKSDLIENAEIKSYDNISKKFSTNAQNGIRLPNIEGNITQITYLVEDTGTDFGHVSNKNPQAVFRPKTIADIQKMIVFANQNQIKIGMRGQGHSAFGQAQVPDGIVIDSRSFNQINEINEDSIWVEAGVTFRDILLTTTPSFKTLVVMPDYLDLSIGGVLSVGGVNGTSQYAGFVVDSALALEVITTDGKLNICSAAENTELFWAVLGGLGQYGIIVRAKLKLEPISPVVQVYMLTYSHFSDFVNAQRKALEIGLFDYMEGQVVPNPASGQWEYMLEGFQQLSPFKTNQDVFANLPAPDRQQLMMLPYLAFMSRVSIFEFEWRRAGVWKTPHPWFDVFVPDSCVDDTVADILKGLTPAEVGPRVILLFPFYHKNLNSPMVSIPDDEIVWLFDILCFCPDNQEIVEKMLKQNRIFFDLLAQRGAKRYPISAIKFEENDWKTHYGENWEKVKNLKQKYDPQHILTPNQKVFG